jgi:hypothetical protein
MSENNENKNIGNDEIDLLDLFRRMGNTLSRWVKSLCRGFLISVVFCAKRWLPLGLSILIGFGVSYLFKATSTIVYTSDMVLKGNSVTAPEIFQYINRLHTYCVENNSNTLAEVLSLDTGIVSNIIDLDTYWIIDQNRDSIPDYVDYNNNQSVNDTANFKIRMQDQINVRIQIKSLQELNVVRNGIISFIEKDSLFQQRNRLRLKQNRELIARIDYDILQLDSLQKIKYFEETRKNITKDGGQIVLLQQQNTQLVYGDIYSLYKTKQLLESEVVLQKSIVTVLSDFSIPVKRVNRALYYGKQIIPIFFCITLLILILVENRKKFKDVFNKYK